MKEFFDEEQPRLSLIHISGASAWIVFGREFFENLKAGLNAPQEGMEKK